MAARESRSTRGESAAVIDVTRIAAVIFDTDGVVTDTAAAHATTWKRVFDGYLRERSERSGARFEAFDADVDYRQYVDGRPRHDGIESFLGSRGIAIPYGAPIDASDAETICGLGNRKNELFLDHLQQEGVSPYPSTVRLLHRLRSAGVRIAVISASRNATAVLSAAGVIDLFEVKIDGVDAAALALPGKPAPAIFLEAANRLAVEPARTAVVEDSLAGVEAARSGAFALVIGVDRTGRGDELLDHGADVAVSDLSAVRVVGADGRQS